MAASGQRCSPACVAIHVPVVADGVFLSCNDVRVERSPVPEETIGELDGRRRPVDLERRKVAGVQVESEQGKAREIDDVIRMVMREEYRVDVRGPQPHPRHLVGGARAAVDHDAFVTERQNA